jgi:NADPH2:quinone reductase
MAGPGAAPHQLEAVGAPDRELARRLTAPFVRRLLYGNSSGAPEPPLTAAALRSENIVAGGMSVTALAWPQPELLRQIIAEAFSLVAAGAVKVDVRHVLGLNDAAEAYRFIESCESTGKVVLELR